MKTAINRVIALLVLSAAINQVQAATWYLRIVGETKDESRSGFDVELVLCNLEATQGGNMTIPLGAINRYEIIDGKVACDEPPIAPAEIKAELNTENAPVGHVLLPPPPPPPPAYCEYPPYRNHLNQFYTETATLETLVNKCAEGKELFCMEVGGLRDWVRTKCENAFAQSDDGKLFSDHDGNQDRCDAIFPRTSVVKERDC